MAFSDDAIGFYLQLEDELSPVLAKATSNYEHFVSQLDKFNKATYKSAKTGLGAVADLVDQIGGLPQVIVSGYEKALKKVNEAAQKKSVQQKVVMQIDAKSSTAIGKSVAQSVVKALKSANIRLSATVPLKKDAHFDTSVTLRAAYKEMTQPPDMMGVFQGLPRYAEGGVVEGKGAKGVDSVVAMVAPGEMVIPADVVDKLRSTAAKLLGAKGSVMFTAKDVDALGAAAEHMEAYAEAAEDAEAPNKGFRGFLEFFKKVGLSEMLDNAKGALQSLGDAFQQTQSEVSGLFGEIDNDKLMSFQEGTRELARGWGMNREELSDLRDRLAGLADADVGLNLINEAQQRLVEAGAKNVEQLEKYARITAIAAKAGLQDFAEEVFRMGEGMGLTQGQIARVTNQMTELNQQTGLGADTINTFTQKLMDAANGSGEALDELGALGISAEELASFTAGDAAPAISKLVQTLGAAAEGGQVMQDALRLDWIDTSKIQGFKGRVEETTAALRAGDAAFEAAGGGLQALNENTRGADTWFDRLSNTVGKFAQDSFGPLIELFEEINPLVLLSIVQIVQLATTVLPMLWTGLVAVGGAVASVTLPVWGLIAVIGALVAGIVWLFTKFNIWQELWANLKEELWSVAQVFIDTWDMIKGALAPVFDMLSDGGAGGGAMDWLRSFAQGLGMVFGFLIDTLGMVLWVVAQVIKWTVGPLVTAIGWVIGIIIKLVMMISDSITYLVTAPGEAISASFALVGDAFMWLYDTVVGFFSGIWDAITGFVSGVWEFLGLDQLGSAISGLFGMIVDMIMAPIDFIKWAINTLIITPLNWVLSWDPPLIPGGSIGEILGIGTITPFAEGGVVTGPTMGLVGEAGPEAIIPLDDVIVDAEALRAYVDNAEVVAQQMETNTLLRKILAATEREIVISGPGVARRGGVSPETRMLAEGRL